MKSLSELLSAITVEEIIGSEDKMITSLVCDSRKIELGSLFVAIRGVNVDGHKFIPIVTVGGVAAIVCEELPERLESTITYIRVSNSAVALGFLASQWYDNPSRHLTLVGVTGTNGKTTTATLIYEMARLGGHKAGLLPSQACGRQYAFAGVCGEQGVGQDYRERQDCGAFHGGHHKNEHRILRHH